MSVNVDDLIGADELVEGVPASHGDKKLLVKGQGVRQVSRDRDPHAVAGSPDGSTSAC